jgi:hypothetical protein
VFKANAMADSIVHGLIREAAVETAFFSCCEANCVLQSLSQFGNTAVSRSSHPVERHLLSRPAE